METQECFLLSYLKYGDNDAILNCFGKDSGFFTAFARGIYASKNKKKAYLFPLNQLKITFINGRKSSNLPNVSKIERVVLGYDFNDVKVNAILFFVADFLNQVVKEETYPSKIYFETEEFFVELLAENFSSYIGFIFKILSIQGISPLYENLTYLNPETGNFESEKSHQFFDKEISNIWKNYLIDDKVYQIQLNRTIRKKVLDSLMIYYSIHFSGFFEPKSLEIIQQIFD